LRFGPGDECARAETHWKSAETLNSIEVFEDHLARFPNCEFAVFARAKIKALKN
jgi:outer membrane protein assembly factor BamD (BamD/ComL family)